MPEKSGALVQGTLDMLILKTLALEPLHGYGIAQRIEQVSQGVFSVNPGSLFPAFRRLEREGWIKPVWKPTDNNRRAKYYALTARGRKQLQSETETWGRQSAGAAAEKPRSDGRCLPPIASASRSRESAAICSHPRRSAGHTADLASAATCVAKLEASRGRAPTGRSSR